MRNDCIEAVQEALGRSLRKGESEEIENTINSQMRRLAREDPEGWRAKGKFEQLQEASDAAAAELARPAQLKAERVMLNIAAHDRLENGVADILATMKPKELLKPGMQLRRVSQLLAFDAGGRGMRSVESNSNGLSGETLGELMPLWENVKGFAGLFQNGKGIRDLVHELFGEDTGNAAAKRGAEIWKQITEELRQRANAAGGNIGKLLDYHFPQTHSQSRIAQAGGNAKDPSAALAHWIGDTMPLLDRGKYVNEDGSRMNDSRLHDFLQHAWESIVMDGMNKIKPGEGRAGMGGVADRGSAHRQIFFKDAESYLKYQGSYGDRNLMSVLTGHIRSISRDIALLETLGTTPEKNFKYYNDRTMQDELRQNPAAKDKIMAQHKLNEALYDEVAGKTTVVNQKLADIRATFNNQQVASKLGNVVLTAFGDEAGMMATAAANKVPFTEVMQRELHYMNPANADDRAVAGHAALGNNSVIGGLDRFSGEDMALAKGVGATAAARAATARLATASLHLSGAEFMWDTRRKALGSVLMSYLGRTVSKVEHFADLNQTDHGILATKGIDEKVWQTWRKAEPEDWGMKHGVLTARSIRDIPDAVLAKLGDPQTLRRNASTALLGHILEETGMGVMDTGARERTRMRFGTTAGTIPGELLRSVMLFKGFSASMMMKHWARASSLPTSGQRFGYAASLVTMGTIMGAVAIQLRNLASGKDPANILEPRFWLEAGLRGGGLGYYGDFLYSELNSHDTSLIPAVIGPLATEAETAWHLTGGNAFKHLRGERTDEAASAIRWGKSEIPVLNNWYTKAAWDHMVWNNFQEAASPGYLDRMQLKAQQTRGSTYWWGPHQGMPNAAPDMAKMFQPSRGEDQLHTIAQAVEHVAPSLE